MFNLACPWVLCALPLPLLIYALCGSKKGSPGGALPVPFYVGLSAAFHGLQQARHVNWRQYLACVIWGLLVFAASGPQWLGSPIATKQSGRNILLALDISGSMQTPDLSEQGETRLAVVKSVAKAFIQHREGDRLGLILFGTQAYLQTPLTFDHHTLETLLDEASVGLAGPQTAIGDALGLAIKRLTNVPASSRIIILLTDGVANAGSILPRDAAKQAAKLGIKIYTVGLGAEKMVLNHFLGTQTVNPSADLDEKTLKQIAKRTGGKYFRAKDSGALAKAYEAIDRLEPSESDKRFFRPITPLFRWPLGLAMLLSGVLSYRYWAKRGRA